MLNYSLSLSFCSLQNTAGRVYLLPPWACGFSSSAKGWINWYVLNILVSFMLLSWVFFLVLGLSRMEGNCQGYN